MVIKSFYLELVAGVLMDELVSDVRTLLGRES